MNLRHFCLAAAAALALAGIAHSQSALVPQTPQQRLQAIKEKNKQLIDKQTDALKKLDEMELQSQQLKFLGKRT